MKYDITIATRASGDGKSRFTMEYKIADLLCAISIWPEQHLCR